MMFEIHNCFPFFDVKTEKKILFNLFKWSLSRQNPWIVFPLTARSGHSTLPLILKDPSCFVQISVTQTQISRLTPKARSSLFVSCRTQNFRIHDEKGTNQAIRFASNQQLKTWWLHCVESQITAEFFCKLLAYAKWLRNSVTKTDPIYLTPSIVEFLFYF